MREGFCENHVINKPKDGPKREGENDKERS